MNPYKLSTHTQTEDIAARLAGCCVTPCVIYLEGELGAGKTTFARAFIQARGVNEFVKSPTYSLYEYYSTNSGPIIHLDLYRIMHPEEMDYLGLDHMNKEKSIWLIEWPNHGGTYIPQADLMCILKHVDEGRTLEVHYKTSQGEIIYRNFLAALGMTP